MPYRDPSPAPETRIADLTAPARLLGAYAAVQVAFYLVQEIISRIAWSHLWAPVRFDDTSFRSSNDDTWRHVMEHPVWLWIPVAFAVFGIASTSFIAVRAKERHRALAIASTILTASWLVLTIRLWLSPQQPVMNADYAWPVRLYPALHYIRPMMLMAAHPLAAWSIARRGDRLLPWLVTVGSWGCVHMWLTQWVDRPYVQAAYAPSMEVTLFARSAIALFFALPLIWVALLGFMRRRDDLDRRVHTSPIGIAAPPGIAIAIGCATFAVAIGCIALIDPEVGVRAANLESTPVLVYLVQGITCAGAVAFVLTAREANQKNLAVAGGCASVVVIGAALLLPMRGILRVPITPTFSFGTLVLVWALGVGVLAILAALLFRSAEEAVLRDISSASENRLASLAAEARAARSRYDVALGPIVLLIIVIGVSEWSRAHGAQVLVGLVGLVSIIAMLAWRSRYRAVERSFEAFSREAAVSRSPES